MGNYISGRDILTSFVPALIFVLCLMVMGAWVLGFDWPIFLGTNSAMQFNTALSLALLSLSVLVTRYFYGLSRLLALLVFLLSFLNLVQYAFGWDIGIDQMFVVEDAPVFPGRMSIMTSLSLCIVSLELMHILTWNKRTVLTIMVIMSVPLSLAIIALIGYMLNIETAYSWFGMREMALHTALFVFFLVLAVLIKRKRAWSDEGSHKVYVGTVLSIGIAVVLGLSAAEFRIEEQSEQNYLASTAISVEKDITLYQQSLQLDAVKLTTFLEAEATLLETKLAGQVDWLLQQHPTVLAVMIVQNNQIMWQHLDQNLLDYEALETLLWPNIQQSIQQAHFENGQQESTLSQWSLLRGEGLQSGQVIHSRMFVHNDQPSTLIFVADLGAFFEQLAQDVRYNDSYLKIQFGQDVVYGQSPEGFGWDQKTQQYFYPIGDEKLTLTLAINPDSGDLYLAHIWYLFLVSGFSMLFLIVVAFYFYLQNKNYRFAVSSWHNNLEKTFRNMNVAILAVNAEGEISLVNDNTIALFGYSEQELLGQKVEMLVPPSVAGLHPKYRDKFMEGNLSRPMENNDGLYGYKKNGDIVPLDIGLGKVENSEDVAVVLTIVDQTMRREAEEKIKEYTNELEQKNIDLANFSRILSHDLRDPIGRIITLTEMIEIYIKSNSYEKALDYIKVIEQSADYAQNLITQLYNHISKGSGFSSQLCSVDSLITLAINTTNGLSDNDKVTLSVDYDQDLKVNVNEALIVQVLNNLLANALKYNNKDKPVIQITAHLREADNMVVFGVADNGPGIPQEHLQSIFNIFDRGSVEAETSPDGMGLGLSTCKKIVNAHKGKIWADTGDDEGATFYFTLPLHQ